MQNKEKLLGMYANFNSSSPDNAALENTPIEWGDLEGFVAGGLGETLLTAVKATVNQLGADGGFQNNPQVKIPLPESMKTAAGVLNAIGQDQLVDNFVASMNHAAEQAVKASPDIFVNSISQMTITDVQAIWKGEGSALTDFFQRTSRNELSSVMMPIIKNATDSTGATRSLKAVIDAIPQDKSIMGGLGKISNAMGGNDVSTDINLDLDQYVLEKALNGLFTTLAVEESKIRSNPQAYSTGLVKSLFEAF